METANDRIQQIVAYSGLSGRAFCRKCNISSATLRASRETPNGSTLISILTTFPELSPDWLLLGKGEMLRSNDSTEKTPTVEVEETEQELPKKRYTDDMSVQERLELYIKSKGLGNYQFEMKVGLSQGYVKGVRNCLHPEKIKRIANVFPDLNIEWMIIGRGEMIVNKPNKLYENEIYRLLKEKEQIQEDIISKLQNELRETNSKRAALEKENKRLVKNLHDMSEMYAEQISTTLADIQRKLAV